MLVVFSEQVIGNDPDLHMWG